MSYPSVKRGENAEGLRSLKQLRVSENDLVSMEEVLEYFQNGWDLYEKVMSSLKEDADYYVQPNRLRHPLIFYLGHTATFYVNKLQLAGCITDEERPNPRFEQMFAVGVDEQSWDDVHSSHYCWPPVTDVWAYRKQVHVLVEKAIRETDWSVPVTWDAKRQWGIVMCLEHERIHLETSTVLIREMEVERLVKPDGWAYGPTNGKAPKSSFVKVKANREVTLGKSKAFPTYSWDIELGQEKEYVESFEVSSLMVTNYDWLLFINAKGYERRELWDEEGWNWLQFSGAKHPHFWVALDASRYMYRAIYDVIELPLDWPAEVNELEAAAYCRWKGEGFRLMSEAEYRLISTIPEDVDGAIATDPALDVHASKRYNLDFSVGSSTPVTHYPANALGIHDAFGNAWEWSSSVNTAFAGYRLHELYIDFSSPCIDDKHNMILGGSWASTGNLTSVYARYSFRRHFFQHAGFRLCRTLSASEIEEDKAEAENVYETQKSLCEYLLFHYGSPEQLLGDFLSIGPSSALEYPQRCAERCLAAYRAAHGETALPKRALDMGCAVGRSSFELARGCEEVLGIDYSHAFVAAGNALVKTGERAYTYRTEGDIERAALATVDSAIDRQRVRFEQGDAHVIEHLGKFDLFLGANLVDRLHHPRTFLEQLPRIMNKGGIVLLTTPFTWLQEFTAKENWLGGYVDSETGKEVWSADTLLAELGEHFERVEEDAMPFLIRETRRKFQWTAAYASVWRRK